MIRATAQAGLSLVEMAIVISALALVTGVMAPAGFDLVAQARTARAQYDCDAIRGAMLSMLNDVGTTVLTRGGRGVARVDLLVSDGPAPAAARADTTPWTDAVEGTGRVDLLARHLITNDPAGALTRAWTLPRLSGEPGWRGAYLTREPGADPWGHRYAVNVRYLGERLDVLVLSAGPNGTIETPFEGRQAEPGGDDIAAFLR